MIRVPALASALLLGGSALAAPEETAAPSEVAGWAREIAEQHRAMVADAASRAPDQGPAAGAGPAGASATLRVAGQDSRPDAGGTAPGPGRTASSGKPADGAWLFASRSLGSAALREIFAAASRDGMTVVFRGVPEGARLADGLRDLQEMAASLDPSPAVILDPGRWREWQVDLAPTLMLVEDGNPVARVRGMTDPGWLERAVASGARGDLGTQGPIEAPSEPDLIAVLQERAADLDFAALKQRAVQRYWERAPLYPLSPAEQDLERAIDLSVRVERDIKTASGTVVARAGQVIDPLAVRPFTLRLVVFDATRPVEVAFAGRQLAEHADALLIATALDRERGWDGLRALEEALDRPVYLLTPDLRDRFALRHTPSVVEACGPGRVCVRETALAAQHHQP